VHRVGGIEEVYYVPDFLSEADAAAIEAQLIASPPELWGQMAGRRVQECGSRMAPSGQGLLREELPPWMRAITRRLLHHGAFPAVLPPNSVALNEYRSGEGIAPHADGPIYAPLVAIVSLGRFDCRDSAVT
jgi:alkylated DNA repair protein alkB homolog 6